MKNVKNEKLKKRMRDSGFRLDYIASKLGITRVALHNKVSGKYEFVSSEIVILRDLLKLSDKDVKDIFLT